MTTGSRPSPRAAEAPRTAQRPEEHLELLAGLNPSQRRQLRAGIRHWKRRELALKVRAERARIPIVLHLAAAILHGAKALQPLRPIIDMTIQDAADAERQAAADERIRETEEDSP